MQLQDIKSILTSNDTSTRSHHFYFHADIEKKKNYRKMSFTKQADILYITFFVTNSHSIGGVGSILCLDSVPLVTCYVNVRAIFFSSFSGSCCGEKGVGLQIIL